MLTVSSVDGFDMVGKTPLLKKLESANDYNNYDTVYDVDYKNTFTEVDKVKNSYLIGMSQLDLLSKLNSNIDLSVLYNRSFPSSKVYYELLSPSDKKLGKGISSYRKLLKNIDELKLYYVSHSSTKSAKMIYDNCNGTNDHNDALDKFLSFDEYMKVYHKIDKLYLDTYKELLNDESLNVTFYHYVSEAHSDGDYVILKEVKDENWY